jgi:hypothetical protein
VFEGFTTDLVLAAFCAWGVATLVAARDMPMSLGAILATIRVGIPLVYFALYYDTTWNVGDDLVYCNHGSELIAGGYNPLTVLIDSQGWDYLLTLARGHHVMYDWWNLAAMSLFGEHYYAPVFANVALSFVGSSLLARTARQLGFAPGYCLGLQIFWLLHWDLIAWSSLLNVKDVLVQTLTIALFNFLASYIIERRASSLAGLLVVAQFFWWIRFYVPVIVLTAVMIWMLTQWNDARRYLFIPLGALAYYYALPLIAGAADYWRFDTLAYGMLRFTLTPIPWQVHEEYAYLEIPTVLHWICFVPAVLGTLYLWRESPHVRLFLIYLACLIALYAVTEDLLGPRQRFQVSFLFAWAQFHFMWRTKPDRAIAGVPARTVQTGSPRWSPLPNQRPAWR